MKTAIRIGVLLVPCCAFASAVWAAGTRADLDGVWLFYSAQVPKDPGLTPAGRGIHRPNVYDRPSPNQS